MKSMILASVVASAAAFAPAKDARASTSLNAFTGPYDKEIGAMAPVSFSLSRSQALFY